MAFFNGLNNQNRQQQGYGQNGYSNNMQNRSGNLNNNYGNQNNYTPYLNRNQFGNNQMQYNNAMQNGNQNWNNSMLNNNTGYLNHNQFGNNQMQFSNAMQNGNQNRNNSMLNNNMRYPNHNQFGNNQMQHNNYNNMNNNQGRYNNTMQNGGQTRGNNMMAPNNNQTRYNDCQQNSRQQNNRALNNNQFQNNRPPNGNQQQNTNNNQTNNALPTNNQIIANMVQNASKTLNNNQMGNRPNQGNGQPPQTQQIPPEVSFEPLSEELMSKLKSTLPGTQGASDPPPPSNPQEASGLQGRPKPPSAAITEVNVDDHYLAQLKDFIQSEKNASLYYKHLSNISDNVEYRSIFDTISAQNEKLSNSYNEIYVRYSGTSYEAENKTIRGEFGLKDGVKRAIMEECKYLKELSVLYEQTSDEKNSRYFNSILYKKLSDIGMMSIILTGI